MKIGVLSSQRMRAEDSSNSVARAKWPPLRNDVVGGPRAVCHSHIVRHCHIAECVLTEIFICVLLVAGYVFRDQAFVSCLPTVSPCTL